MNIQYQATSVIYGVKSELFSTKEALNDYYAWAEDLVITEIDTDDRDYILRDVPEELKSSISWMAYERGHSAGQDEVASYMREMVSDLLPAILAYGIRMKNSQ